MSAVSDGKYADRTGNAILMPALQQSSLRGDRRRNDDGGGYVRRIARTSDIPAEICGCEYIPKQGYYLYLTRRLTKSERRELAQYDNIRLDEDEDRWAVFFYDENA